MDWDLAIKRNSEALKGIVAELFAMLGLAGEATVSRIPPLLHSCVSACKIDPLGTGIGMQN